MRKVAITLAFVAAAAMLLGLVAEWSRSFDLGSVTPILATSAAGAEVSAIAEFNTNRVGSRKPVDFQVTFCNRSRSTIERLHIAKIMCPGFDFDSSLRAANRFLVRPLAPAERRTVTFTMRPLNTSGQYTIALRYAWSNGVRTSHASVAAGPLIVTSRGRALVTRVGGPVLALFKDLALPIVLAIGAWYLQKQEKKRDEKKKAEEDDRFHQRATWNLMLPVSHEFNTRYYLPLLRAVNLLEADLQKPHSARDCLYDVMLMWRIFRYMTDRSGGLFLKDTKAEDLVHGAWRLAFRQFSTRLDMTDVDRVLAKMSPREGRATFKDRFPTTTDERAWTPVEISIVRLEKAFDPWLRSVFREQTMPAIRIMHGVLGYELNRPFTVWYDGGLEFRQSVLLENESMLAKLELQEYGESTLEVDRWRSDIPSVRTELRLYVKRRLEPAAEAG